MDAGEDIIDVLYRFRDRSNSPMQRTLTRSRTVRNDDDTHEHQELQRRSIQQQMSAPPPPRNYERDLYNFNRQSLALRGRLRQSDSVFHRQNFNPSNQQSFYKHTRSRCNSDNNEDGAKTDIRRGKSYRDKKYRPHKSEDSLDVDFEKSRSIKVDVIPRLDVEPKHDSDDLILMPNGTRQRRRKLIESNATTSTKTTLHRTDNQSTPCLSSSLSQVGINPEGLDEDAIYLTTAAAIESDIYENVQVLGQTSDEMKPPIGVVQEFRNTSTTESKSNYNDSERIPSGPNSKMFSRDSTIESYERLNTEKSPKSCAVHQIFEEQRTQEKKKISSANSPASLKCVRSYTWNYCPFLVNFFFLHFFIKQFVYSGSK